MALNLQDFGISETTGFLLENPLDKLPVYFQPWNWLAENMPRLVAAGTMRNEIDKMELLDWTRLQGHREQRLAHYQLGILASGYIWQEGEKNAAKKLPKCVAVPLHYLSEHLGLTSIITYPDFILANYRPTDPTEPLDLDNLSAFYCLPGERKASEWFVVIHVAIELEFAKGFQHVLVAVEGGKRGEEETVTSSLVHLTQLVSNMQKIFGRIHEKLEADTFFNELRPYASGWGGEGNPLPDGVIFEGVSDQPQKAIGGSAAQSGTIQVLDALLGVQHSPDKAQFLHKMRTYMLPEHRGFIEAVREQAIGMQKLVKSSTNDDLIQAYNNLLSALISFRSYHIQIVTKYIIQAASRKRQEENQFESLDCKGTGGTNLLPFLKDLRQTTEDCKVTPQSEQ